MIHLCPFCGSQLGQPLRDGIADCSHCHRVFDSSKYNRLLSASWAIRHQPHIGIDQFRHLTKLSESDTLFVYTFVAENLYSHDEFQAYLKDLGVKNKVLS
jgi:hypothetical protein